MAFDRKELALILAISGRKVEQSEWHDYAMDFLRDRAVFSIYVRVSERPLFIVEKTLRLRNRQGQYAMIKISRAEFLNAATTSVRCCAC